MNYYICWIVTADWDINLMPHYQIDTPFIPFVT